MRFELASTSPEVVVQYFQVSGRISRAVTMLGNVSGEGNEMFLVRSQTRPDVTYTVDLRSKTCSCADWTLKGSITGLPCKHQIAAHLQRSKQQWAVVFYGTGTIGNTPHQNIGRVKNAGKHSKAVGKWLGLHHTISTNGWKALRNITARKERKKIYEKEKNK